MLVIRHLRELISRCCKLMWRSRCCKSVYRRRSSVSLGTHDCNKGIYVTVGTPRRRRPVGSETWTCVASRCCFRAVYPCFPVSSLFAVRNTWKVRNVRTLALSLILFIHSFILGVLHERETQRIATSGISEDAREEVAFASFRGKRIII